MCLMAGPVPVYRPAFPRDFVQAAQQMVAKRTVAYELRQRAELAVLLYTHPTIANVAAGAAVRLHPNTDLLRVAAFAHGVDQLNPIRVDDAKHRRGGQEGLRPRVMGHEEA